MVVYGLTPGSCVHVQISKHMDSVMRNSRGGDKVLDFFLERDAARSECMCVCVYM